MTETLETVLISTKNGPVMINKVDFDPSVHTLYGEVAFDRKAAREYLNALGINTSKNISDEKLSELLEETKAKMNG